jgi:hypothetical protein
MGSNAARIPELMRGAIEDRSTEIAERFRDITADREGGGTGGGVLPIRSDDTLEDADTFGRSEEMAILREYDEQERKVSSQ